MPSAFLTRHVEVIGRAITSDAVARAACDAMNESMLHATARYLGADLTLRGFRGAPVAFRQEATHSRARLVLAGGTYALADKGRHRGAGRIRSKQRKRKGERAEPIRTPWGPRVSAKRSKWRGFDITDRHGSEALKAGTDAVIDAVMREVGRA